MSRCPKGDELRALAVLAMQHEIGLRRNRGEREISPPTLEALRTEYFTTLENPLRRAREETERARQRVREHLAGCRNCVEA